jgi:hypothetical protein
MKKRSLWFVITVKIYVITCHLGLKPAQFFVRYKREFVITVIVVTEFDCTYFKKDHLTQKTNGDIKYLGKFFILSYGIKA